MRPTTSKFSSVWDVAVGLDFLSSKQPTESLSIEEMTRKVVMLLALSTASRAQTIASIEVKNIKRSEKRMEIIITKLLKTSRPGKKQPVLIIPKFNQKPELCVASYIEKYLDKTREYRGKEESLFLATKKPFKGVCAQTISKWIKKSLQESGIDTSIFSAHSTRHAATSAAHEKGISLKLIRKTADWSEVSRMFARVYQQPIRLQNPEFAEKVFGL